MTIFVIKQKTFYMKPNNLRLSRTLFFAILLLLSAGTNRAQIFNPATQTEYTYPPFAGPVTSTTHSFTYTISHIAYMTNNPTPPPIMPYLPAPPGLPLSDLTVHTWDDAGTTGGIAYINTATGSGTPAPAAAIYDQGFIPYPDCQGIEVSLMQDMYGANFFAEGTNAPWWVIVSYYYSGPPTNQHPGGAGHYFDTYIWNQPIPNSTGGLTLQYTMQLSAVPTFTRISQDGHNTYGFCITWENPLTGIDLLFGYMHKSIGGGPQISPVYTLAGTLGETHPDVTFTHVGGALNAQFLYYKTVPNGVRIIESEVPFQYGAPWFPIPAPVINDINIIKSACPLTDLKTRIDAPDHDAVADWAYSFILPKPCAAPNSHIYVRYNNSGIKTTYNLTDGSMGNLRCDKDASGSYLNDWPVCSFDATTNWLNVEWYTQFQTPLGFYTPNTGGYVGIRMDNLGNLVSVLDYMQVAEAATLSNTLASYTPNIASSRQNDRTDYQFAAFANLDPMGPGNVMVIKDRVWTFPMFKGGSRYNGADMYNTAAITNSDQFSHQVAAYPNPYTTSLSLDISASLQDRDLTVTISDITGRVIDKIEGKGSTVNTALHTASQRLTSGTYLIKVLSASGDFTKVIKVQKLGTK